MKHKVRKLCIGIVTAVMLITFASCTVDVGGGNFATANRTPDPTPRDLRGIITISGYRSSEYDESLMAYIGEISLAYLGLEVQYDDQYTEEEYFATLEDRIASGDIGDVYLVRDDQIAALAESGKILDLTDYLNSFYNYDPYEKVDIADTVFPAAYQSAMYNGKLYICLLYTSQPRIFECVTVENGIDYRTNTVASKCQLHYACHHYYFHLDRYGHRISFLCSGFYRGGS